MPKDLAQAAARDPLQRTETLLVDRRCLLQSRDEGPKSRRKKNPRKRMLLSSRV